MGLLDDAIREHLELKRKHGANPEDVARQEQEALGPGQRNEFAQPEAPEPEPRRRPPRRGGGARAAAATRTPPRRGAGARGGGRRRRLRGGPVARRRARRGPRRRGARAAPQPPAAEENRRTCWRRRRTSSRRPRSTTASGSSRSRRATSTGTSSPTSDSGPAADDRGSLIPRVRRRTDAHGEARAPICPGSALRRVPLDGHGDYPRRVLVCHDPELVAWRPDFSSSGQSDPDWTLVRCRGERLTNALNWVDWSENPVQVELCVTGEERHGGLQIVCFDPKPGRFPSRRRRLRAPRSPQTCRSRRPMAAPASPRWASPPAAACASTSIPTRTGSTPGTRTTTAACSCTSSTAGSGATSPASRCRRRRSTPARTPPPACRGSSSTTTASATSRQRRPRQRQERQEKDAAHGVPRPAGRPPIDSGRRTSAARSGRHLVVEARGIEPLPRPCKGRVLPLSLRPREALSLRRARASTVAALMSTVSLTSGA